MYQIYFLYHSGFLVETDDALLIFDYYQDPAGILEKKLRLSEKPAYFFVSHVHGDHFNPAIAEFEKRAAGYVLHRDCRLTLAEHGKAHYMDVGETLTLDGLTIKMYGSTDEGGSYLVKGQGISIFHAGDLNWWHWAGEPKAENLEAGRNFHKELSRIEERHVDIAFFPVDARLAVAREWGAKAFLAHTDCGLLVAMHAFGAPWAPSYEFRYTYPEQKLWIPSKPGENFEGEINNHE